MNGTFTLAYQHTLVSRRGRQAYNIFLQPAQKLVICKITQVAPKNCQTYPLHFSVSEHCHRR